MDISTAAKVAKSPLSLLALTLLLGLFVILPGVLFYRYCKMANPPLPPSPTPWHYGRALEQQGDRPLSNRWWQACFKDAPIQAVIWISSRKISSELDLLLDWINGPTNNRLRGLGCLGLYCWVASKPLDIQTAELCLDTIWERYQYLDFEIQKKMVLSLGDAISDIYHDKIVITEPDSPEMFADRMKMLLDLRRKAIRKRLNLPDDRPDVPEVEPQRYTVEHGIEYTTDIIFSGSTTSTLSACKDNEYRYSIYDENWDSSVDTFDPSNKCLVVIRSEFSKNNQRYREYILSKDIPLHERQALALASTFLHGRSLLIAYQSEPDNSLFSDEFLKDAAANLPCNDIDDAVVRIDFSIAVCDKHGDVAGLFIAGMQPNFQKILVWRFIQTDMPDDLIGAFVDHLCQVALYDLIMYPRMSTEIRRKALARSDLKTLAIILSEDPTSFGTSIVRTTYHPHCELKDILALLSDERVAEAMKRAVLSPDQRQSIESAVSPQRWERIRSLSTSPPAF